MSLRGAEYVHHHYHLRDISEKGYSEIKTQLGYEVPRNHTTEGVENKLFVCMISSIIRMEYVEASKLIGIPTNQMIKEMDRIHMFFGQSEVYIQIHNESERQKAFLEYFGLIPEDLDDIVEDVNSRESVISSQYRKLPRIEREKLEKQKALEKELKEQMPKRKRGRPKGSKSKSTSVVAKPEKPKGKAERPKGSKNKKTLAKEAREAKSKAKS